MDDEASSHQPLSPITPRPRHPTTLTPARSSSPWLSFCSVSASSGRQPDPADPAYSMVGPRVIPTSSARAGADGLWLAFEAVTVRAAR